MDLLGKALEQTVGAEIALLVAAVGAFFILFLQAVKQTKEFEESPRVRRVVEICQLVGALGVSEGAIAIAWYTWVVAKDWKIEGILLIWMPLVPLIAAFTLGRLLLRMYRRDPNRTSSHATPCAKQCPICGHA